MSTPEVVLTQWFKEDAIRLPDYKVGRIYAGSGRFYIKLDQECNPVSPVRPYTSLTTAIDQCQPMAPQLLKWHCELGYDEAKRISRMKAHYGSLLHEEIGRYLTSEIYDFDRTKESVADYLGRTSYYQPECDTWDEDLKYDMAAFIAFAQEFEIKPLGIEYVLLSERGFGTMIDLVCDLVWPVKGFHGEVYKSGERKGEPKETTAFLPRRAIINFKSGRHGFYDSHGLQLTCEKMLWEENFPDLPVDLALNWSPSEWRSNPSWNLKDWTGEFTEAEIAAVLSLAQIRYADKALNKKFIDIKGTAISTRPVRDCIAVTGLEEYAFSRYGNLMGKIVEP